MATPKVSIELLADIGIALRCARAALARAPGNEAWEAYKRVIHAQGGYERELKGLGNTEIAEMKTANPERLAA